MPKEPITIYKLIILYMLVKVQIPLTSQTVSEYILGRGYTNYFNLQLAFHELLEADLIEYDTTYKTTYYQLTPKGQDTLQLFKSQLSYEIRLEIEAFLKENQHVIMEELSVFTNYGRLPNGEYETILEIKEYGQSLMKCNLTVATEKDAAAICKSFEEKKEEVYQYMIRTLLNE